MALILAFVQAIICLLFFGLFLGIRSLLKSDPPRIKLEGINTYAVFQRKEKWLALKSDNSFQLWDALFYAGFFYLWLPVLVYRYGWGKAFFLVALPFVGMPLGALLASNYGEPAARMFVGMVLVAFIRAMLSIIVGVSSVGWVRQAKIIRGWTLVGECSATAATEAIRVFNPPVFTPKPMNLFKRLHKFFVRAPRTSCSSK